MTALDGTVCDRCTAGSDRGTGRTSVGRVGIVVKHVCQDVLGVLKPLSHLCVVALKSLVQGQCRALSLLVDIRYKSAL